MPEMKTIKFPGSDEIYEVTDAAAREALEKKLNADKLQEAVEAALEQAKTSGEFNGLTPHIGANGNWYIGDIDTGLPSRGEDGDDGFSPVVTVSKDGKLTTIKITTAQGDAYARIVDGSDGSPGVDGVSPTVSISKSGKVTTISIADKGGTKTATVNDGVDGSNGKDGTSVTVKSVSESTADGGSNVVTFSDGKTLTVKNGSKGGKGADGATPVRGTDYWSPADQESIVQQVIAALGTPVFGRVDADKNLILRGDLVNGTYKINFENDDGTLNYVCDYVVGPAEPVTENIPIEWDVGLKLGKNDNNHTTVSVVEGTANSNAYAASQHIEYSPEASYTIAMSVTGYRKISVCCYDEAGDNIGYLSDLIGESGADTGPASMQFTPVSGTKTFRFRLWFGYNGKDIGGWTDVISLTKTYMG